MRPFKGKENGLVLDNAGLWLEHGLSFIDREWLLEGIKLSKKRNLKPKDIVTFDEEGIIREIKDPKEAEGLELTELTEEFERLLTFESFLRIALSKEHNILSAVYRYKEHLVSKSVEMSNAEEIYCRKRLLKLGYVKAKGFLFNVRKDIVEEIKRKGK